MVGKQFSVSVINLATSVNSNRINSNNNNQLINNDQTLLNLLDQRKHALSEESLPTTVRIVFSFLLSRKKKREEEDLN